MKISYIMLFAPKGVKTENVNETKSVQIVRDSRYKTKDDIKKEFRHKAVQNDVLDQYALRNYWYMPCGELKIIDTPWDSIDDLVGELNDMYNAKNIQVNKSMNSLCKIPLSIELYFDNQDDLLECKRELKSKYNGIVPILSKNNSLILVLRSKASIELDNYDDAKSIFKTHLSSD